MRDVTIAIWAFLLASVLIAESFAVAKPSSLATFGDTCSRLMRPVSARAVVLLGWAWLGWHFFVR